MVLWEIGTVGAKPFARMTGDEVVAEVVNGLRLESPPSLPDTLVTNVLEPCWGPIASRPTFRQLRMSIAAEQQSFHDRLHIPIEWSPVHHLDSVSVGDHFSSELAYGGLSQQG